MIRLVRKRMFEMALEKSKYQSRVFDLMPQIIQNWCLCYFCREHDKNNNSYRGWRKELIAHIGNLNSIPVKGNKYKWTYEEIITDDEFNNIDVIRKVCEYKLDDEDEIELDEIELLESQKIRNELYQSFSDNVEFIVRLISDDKPIKQTIEKIFPIKTDKK